MCDNKTKRFLTKGTWLEGIVGSIQQICRVTLEESDDNVGLQIERAKSVMECWIIHFIKKEWMKVKR